MCFFPESFRCNLEAEALFQPIQTLGNVKENLDAKLKPFSIGNICLYFSQTTRGSNLGSGRQKTIKEETHFKIEEFVYLSSQSCGGYNSDGAAQIELQNLR